jgi:hypothetical protein
MPPDTRPRSLSRPLAGNGRVAAATTAGWFSFAAAAQGRGRSPDLS